MVKVPGSMHWHQVHFSSSQGYYYCHMASNAGMLFLTCLIVLIKVSFHTVKKISLQTGVLFEIVAPCLHTGTTFIHLLMRSQFRSFRLLKRWSVVSSLHDQIRPNYWVIPVSIKAGFSDMPLCYFIEQCMFLCSWTIQLFCVCWFVCPVQHLAFILWSHSASKRGHISAIGGIIIQDYYYFMPVWTLVERMSCAILQEYESRS